MKKLYTAISLQLFLINAAPAQWFFTQYFDGADTVFSNSVNIVMDTSSQNIWQIGAPQKTIFSSAATAPNAMVTDTINFYPVNNISRFKTRVENPIFNWGILAIQWKQKLDLDHGNDGGLVEFTTDNGLTWENAFNNPLVYNFYGFYPGNVATLPSGEFAFTGTDTSWSDIWLCFSLSWISQFPDTLTFRFTLKSDSIESNQEGWMIDNLLAHITAIHTVGENDQESYLNIYPNPSGAIVHVQAKAIMEYHIIESMELTDITGRRIDYWQNIPVKYWFNTVKYQDGLYLLKLKTNLKTETHPLMICHH